jgi:tRNA(adenine34) deaminase
MTQSDEFYMREAIKEARKAALKDEVPVGAVIVCNDQVIGRSHNQTELLKDFTAHAEMIAFTSASEFLGNKYLNECTLYVTLEPCPMCAGASFWTQLKRIVYGASDPKRGYSRHNPDLMHPKTEILSGMMAQDCQDLLTQYFRNKR